MYCSNCGGAIAGSPAFCGNCGARVTVAGQSPIPPAGLAGTAGSSRLPNGGDLSAFDYFKRGYTEKFATFTGRARRREYWFFTLFTLLFFIALGVVGAVLGSGNEDVALGVVLLGMLVSIIPSIAVQVRRLHDVGRSGWFILLNLIPYVGPLVLLVFMVLDSQPGDNRFGPNPKT